MSRKSRRRRRRTVRLVRDAFEEGHDAGFELGWDEAMDAQRQVMEGRRPAPPETHYPKGWEGPPGLPRKSG